VPFGHSTVIFNMTMIVDDFTLVMKSIILFFALSSILLGFAQTKTQKINEPEYVTLILFSSLSALFIVSSYDLISMYLAIELQSLSFYVLAAFQRNNEFSTEAGLKYFILGALSSGLLLFGESILYGFTGITNFEELAKLLLYAPFPSSERSEAHIVPSLQDPFAEIGTLSVDKMTAVGLWPGATIGTGLLFILVAFLFKISAVPFHM
jgi:NADH-quinone oxidoreductase subunit N